VDFVTVRSVHNADLPSLVAIWNQHWNRLGFPVAVSWTRFEQAILSRTFFRPESLLIVEAEAKPLGWAHFLHLPESASTAVVCAICLGAHCSPDLAAELLRETLVRIDATGAHKIEVGTAQDSLLGYGGLAPVGHCFGIPKRDQVVARLLAEQGFQPSEDFVRLLVTVPGYRPPVSREGLQLRRISRVERQKRVPHDLRQASSMSHLDIETFRLLDRTNKELAQLDLWFSDAEAEVMSPGTVILDLARTGVMSPEQMYLLGATIVSLSDRRISNVEAVIRSDAHVLQNQLQSLQFQIADEGSIWRRS
jgi:hypothetical protein